MSRKPAKARIDPVEVYARVRPTGDEDAETCLKILDENTLMMEIPECSNAFRSGQANGSRKMVYSFQKIFDETTSQKEIFNQLGLPLCKDLLDGKNGLLFSYGVTGSGKTYSMIGNQHEPGILQRCLDTVFNSISFTQAKKYFFKPDRANSFDIQSESDASSDRKNIRDVLAPQNTPIPTSSRTVTSVINQFNSGTASSATPSRTKALADARRLNSPNGKICNVIDEHVYAVFVSCIEIYNNYIYDLLDEFSVSSDSNNIKRMDNSKESKNLKEDAKGCMYIKDAVEIEVKSTEEALELMHRAQKRRVVAYTDLNSESSRSHSIFTIRIVQSNYDANSDETNSRAKANVFVSQLSLVDLAGSERTKRTKNTGSRLREAGNINSSLMALRSCMEVLRENIMNGTKKIVPYRESKLTLLFKNYFEGHGHIKMVLCINPRSIEFDETINVLKFSDLVKDILIPTQTTTDVQRHLARQINESKNVSVDILEQQCSQFFTNYLQSNQQFTSEAFPTMDVFSHEDSNTVVDLIEYLENYRRKHTPFVHEFESLRQLYFVRLKDTLDEVDKIRDERDEYKSRLDGKERDQSKFDSKIKALEKVINTNSYRTPSVGLNKENRFATPAKAASGGSGGSSNGGSGQSRHHHHHHITGTVSGHGTKPETVRADPPSIERPSTISHHNPKTPITSTFRSNDTPIQTSSYKSSQRFTHQHGHSSTVTQSINRFQQAAQLPPHTPLKEGVPVANKRNQSRRSKSADLWLDHKPTNTAKIDTVLQPKFGRKKSVSKLELNECKKSTRYALTHQQQDGNGEVVTNLIKGDLLRSPSGGANCIFTDIETLNVRAQETGGKSSRKRISVEDVGIDEAIVQERCAISIEGHVRGKPIKKTKF